MSYERQNNRRPALISAALALSALLCSRDLVTDAGATPITNAPEAGSAPADSKEAPSNNDPSGLLLLQPFTVTASVYKLPRTALEILKLKLFWDLKADFGWPSIGGPFVLTPGRLPQRTKNVAYSVSVLESKALHALPSSSLAETLLSAPEFSFLPDTNDHASANVTLRGMSALVLLDGVPLNNPFDGGIAWAEVPKEGLARAELVPGGGASAWGNGAFGGVIQFSTLPAKGKMIVQSGPPPDGGPPDPNLTKQVILSTTQLATMIGGLDTQSAEFVTSQPTGTGVLQVLGRTFHTGGFSPVDTQQRGPVDRTAWNQSLCLEARWRQPINEGVEAVATVRGYDETFRRGTAYQQGSSHGSFASVALAGSRTVEFVWNALAYLQRGSSTSTFSAVTADRTGELPAIDQFAAPTTAVGASWSGAWYHTGDSRTLVGADFRSVSGETRENLDFSKGIFARQSIAGGRQDFAGLFIFHYQALTSALRATLGARIDPWDETDGHRHESDPRTNTPLLDKHYAPQHGMEFSPSAGIVWQPNRNWRWRANAQQAFRRPTLAEHYQTSGSDSVVTFANSDLRTEHNTSFEMAAAYTLYQTPGSGLEKNSARLTFEARAFSNELRDTIGTVTIARGAGDFSLLDLLPAGYRGEREINVDRARVQGLRFSSTWHPSPLVTVEAGALLNDTEILNSSRAPGLVGKQLPHVPRRTARLSATWHISKQTCAQLRIRSIGRRFIDGENTLLIDDTIIVDFSADYVLNRHTTFYFTIENLTDERGETDRSADGLVYIDSPRIALGGVKLDW